MTRVIRVDFDVSPLDQPRKLLDGSVIVSGRAARTGDHQYPWGIERRDADELQLVTRQLTGLSVLVGHPDKLLRYGGEMPHAGWIMRADVRGDHAHVDMRLNGTGIKAYESGRRELSLGYETTVINGSQTQTHVDHLAMVHSSRCGETCSIRVDCDGDHSCSCYVTERIEDPAIELRVYNLLGASRLRS